ncbi:MAG: hypothetical protein AAF603_09485, partial [Pseudomonadota bacterium]
RRLSDKEGLQKGYVTREAWRKAMWGYGDLRAMNSSAVLTTGPGVIRYDEFPDMDHVGWQNVAKRFTEKGKLGAYDIKAQTGVKKVASPVVARLKAAWEIGAVYHHNLPHLFLEHRGNINPEVIGQWAVDLWADQSIPLESKLAIFNDNELDHVDAFGADMMKNRQYIVNNQVKVEVSNETWNNAPPFSRQGKYFRRKLPFVAEQMGRPELPRAARPHIAQTGYDLTKAIARLRKKYPAIEWRGVMAVQTNWLTRMNNATNPGPKTELGEYNYGLHSLMTGYRLFWEDYANNREEWSKLYASEPQRAGDWFEAQGTTYFKLSSKLPDLKTHLGGIPPEELQARTADKAEWPKLRAELLDFFINTPRTGRSINDEHGEPTMTSTLDGNRHLYQTLAQSAAYYGMQVASYEGGSHVDWGNYYKRRVREFPEIKAFFLDFHNSVEMGVIQAAAHDAAVAAGWKTLADFSLVNGSGGYNNFGTRRYFEDANPRYCEYARWMPAKPKVSEALKDVSGLISPHARCGDMIDYLNQAKANGYYVK